MFGTIVLYKPDRAYGFIRQAGQAADLFFHISELGGDPASLVKGAKVEFDLGEVKGKPVARDVRLLVEVNADER